MAKYIVTGGAGFIGSHLTDHLIELGHDVWVVDNFLSGYPDQVNKKATLLNLDMTEFRALDFHLNVVKPDGIFHMGAIARTPWCIEDPLLAGKTNVMGTLNVLEVARKRGIKRCVLSSSNVVYAAQTPYRTTKEMGEMWGRVYNELYGVSNISLRYSNVYGTRQSEHGPSPNVFASLRKTLREKGYLEITGDGSQTRHYTHVKDIARGLVLAMNSDYAGPAIDLCHNMPWSMNEVAGMFGCSVKDGTIKYLPPRLGDVEHIHQSDRRAKNILGWEAEIDLPVGIKDCL